MTSKPTVHYAWYADGIFGGVFETTDEADNDMVFTTFRAARRALVLHFHSMVDMYKDSIRDAQALRKVNVEKSAPFGYTS